VDTRRAGLAALLAATIGELAALRCWAQTSDDQLQEVVVTARKGDEALLNVPTTESVFTQQTIQAAGIVAPRDFIWMVPNMTLVEAQNVGNSFFTIRGISQARNSEPSGATWSTYAA
jgi:iron complex outermembrane recepter protein